MTDKLMNITEDKRMRIIKAAMQEFAQRGYKDAKTDTIVGKAGISKGLLFHYFGTKKKLFLFILDYTLEVVENEFLPQLSMDKDIFERLYQNSLLKIKLYSQYPDLFNFYNSAHFKGIEEVKADVDTRRENFSHKAYAAAFVGLDLSKFKDDISPQVAIDLITWTVQGFGNKLLAQYKDSSMEDLDFARLTKEFERYLKVLKDSLYKQEV